jgi:G3E family GTPase
VINDSSRFDEDVKYIFFKQLEEAGLIVVNKTDLVDEASQSTIKEYLSRNYPGSKVIFQCSVVEDGVAEWLKVISQQPAKPELRSLDLNYETYASGEAKMGYLDQQLLIRSSTGNAMRDALAIIRIFLEKVRSAGVPVGHLKFWLNDTHKLSFTATTSSEFPRGNEIENASACSLIVNARLQADPAQLYAMMNGAIETTPTDVEVVNSSFFKPGYPRPVYRIEN